MRVLSRGRLVCGCSAGGSRCCAEGSTWRCCGRCVGYLQLAVTGAHLGGRQCSVLYSFETLVSLRVLSGVGVAGGVAAMVAAGGAREHVRGRHGKRPKPNLN